MTVTIMQPAFLPWSGYFDRVFSSDVLVLLDHVTPDLNSKSKYVCRNRIMSANGPISLTVPLKKGARDLAISDIMVADGWGQTLDSMIKTMRQSYAKSAWLPDFMRMWQDQMGTRLVNVGSLYFAASFERFVLDLFFPMLRWIHYDQPTKLPMVVRSTYLMNYEQRQAIKGTELLIFLCQACQATRYISGPCGLDYVDRLAFDRAGIELLLHDYPGANPYPQLHTCASSTLPFDGTLSALDVIASVPRAKTYDVIRRTDSLKPWPV